MTQQEALKELENLTIDYGKRTAEEIERLDEAVDMAIAALREDAVDRPTCDDAVSRQQAVDALIEQMPSPFTADGSHPADEGIFRVQETYADCIETIKLLPSVQPETHDKRTETHACDLISRQAAIDALMKRDKELRNINWYDKPYAEGECRGIDEALAIVSNLPSAQPERLTDDDFETIRIHLNAYKEKLCNQKRWKEAEEYQRIIDRFMAFASAQPEQQHGRIFQEIVVEYPSISTYPEYKGKPYFSIKYVEDGQSYIGYGTYKPEVLSEYLKEYFMPSAQPETVRCKDCKHMITHEGYGYLGEPAYTCEGNMEGWVLPDGFCSHAERKDGE